MKKGEDEIINPTPLIEDIGTVDTNTYDQSEKHDERIDILRAVLVLTNTITGIGLLSTSYCYRTGVVLNTLISFLLATFAAISFYFLIVVSEKTKIDDYSKLIGPALGKKYEWIPHCVLTIILFGVGILYMQYGCSLLTKCLEEFKGIPEWVYNRWFLIFIPIVIIDIPLSMLKTIHKLSYISFASMTLVFVYIFHNIFYFSKNVYKNGFDPQNQMKLFSFTNLVITSIAIQGTSYNCHPNIFPTLEKLQNNTIKRKMITMIIVAICAFLIYTSSGIFGYLTLFDNILDPVAISYYPDGQTFTLITEALYTLLLALSVPLIFWSCRLSFHELFFKSSFTTLRWNIIGISIVILSGIIAVTVKAINTVFSIIGGLFSPLIVYLLPSLYYLRISKDRTLLTTILAYFLIVFGFFTIIISLYNTIIEII